MSKTKEKNNEKFKSPLDMVFNYVRPHWKKLLLLVLLLLASTGLSTLQPLVMAPMVDVVLNESSIFASDESAEPLQLSEVNLNNADEYVSQLFSLGSMEIWDIVLLLTGAYLVIVVLLALVEVITFYLITRVRVSAFRSLQSDLFRHLLSLSMDYFNAQRTGEIVSRLNRDTQNAVANLTNVFRILAVAPITVLFYGYLLARTNLYLMLLIGGIAGLQLFVARLMRTRLKQLTLDEFDFIARVNAYLHEIFQNIRVVKSFVAEDYEEESFSAKVQKLVNIQINRALFRHIEEPIISMIKGIASVGILIFSARELLNGTLTVPGFVLFLYLGRAMIPPMTQLGQVYLIVQEMGASSERVFQILKQQPLVEDGKQKVSDFRETLRFENVSFSYEDAPVLEKVSIEIERGQMVALVGPSGAGKSTLTDLILRHYDPTEGRASIDGVDLRDLQVDSYRRLFGVVAQENLLFNTTLAENIAYGRDGISQDEIEKAAIAANAAEFIESMPEKYETFVGDRGIRLSGGQRQRIAIARAIVHKPEILILDEATSSLDTESERLVQAAIDDVIKDTTAIVVAHRLSTVIHADKIIVMEEGRVEDVGKHAELLERSALYKRLCELQFQLSTPAEDSLLPDSVEETAQS
jgi:subfamily B ATP-binding cassette protein MsbA